ncbi:tyrosine-protein phosphatase [Carnobacterium gallinarum]|uniref:tyrosine-protein phosphatase n=1 Tax=Carnobacterium gallinarum TaxID=2749 RepID=UPI00054DA906|nr:tyrosine-protein phosphatase [Carnobacterium gallinarum]
MTELKTLVNFRDLGGYQTSDGRKVQGKRLLRSGEVVGLSSQDSRILTENYQLQGIIDLRGLDEISEKPDDSLENVNYTNIDILKKNKMNTASEDGMMANLDPEASDNRMKDLYRTLITNDYAIKGYQEFVRLALENTEGSLLFHCFAGKDRTGVGAAILLGMLGVNRKDIMDDYLKTNVQRVIANQLILADAKEKGLNADQLQGLNNLMSVKSEYLETAWQTIEKEYGSFDSYLTTGLAVSKGDKKELQFNYLRE